MLAGGASGQSTASGGYRMVRDLRVDGRHARDVDDDDLRAVGPDAAQELLRKLARAASLLTTPLAPEDILALFNPVYSARQLRGVVTRVSKVANGISLVVNAAEAATVPRTSGSFSWSVERTVMTSWMSSL